MEHKIQLTIGIDNDESKSKILREAVRCIAFRDDKILLLKSKFGDYKLPGGGVEKGESYETAIVREMQEETGYKCNRVVSKVGIVVERKIDKFDDNTIFEMDSHYYLVEVSDSKGDVNLTKSEIEIGLCCEWVLLEDAIINNVKLLKEKEISEWIQRETLVLQLIVGNC